MTTALSKLAQQENENELVLTELKLLGDDSSVYKLVGPALIKQDLDEARSNVEKRLQFIGDEMYERRFYFDVSFFFVIIVFATGSAHKAIYWTLTKNLRRNGRRLYNCRPPIRVKNDHGFLRKRKPFFAPLRGA
jgi:hypothetical protein